jgi:hypothetical protein
VAAYRTVPTVFHPFISNQTLPHPTQWWRCFCRFVLFLLHWKSTFPSTFPWAFMRRRRPPEATTRSRNRRPIFNHTNTAINQALARQQSYYLCSVFLFFEIGNCFFRLRFHGTFLRPLTTWRSRLWTNVRINNTTINQLYNNQSTTLNKHKYATNNQQLSNNLYISAQHLTNLSDHS